MGTRTTLMPLWATIRGGGWLASNALLFDSYNTADAAPVTDPLTAVPGPGLSTVVDTENKFSISDGDLVCSGGKVAPDYGDPALEIGSDNAGSVADYTVLPGQAGYCSFTKNSGTDLRFGFDINADLTSDAGTFWPHGAVLYVGANVAASTIGATGSYKFLCARRSTSPGGFYYIQDGKLIWVDETVAAQASRLTVSNKDLAFSLHDLALVDLTAHGFTNDFLDVTDTKTNPASPTAFNVDANCEINCTFTEETGTSVGVEFRRADANNYLKLLFAHPANDTMYLYKNIGAGDVLIGTGPILSDGVPYEIDIVANGSDVEVFVDKVSQISVSETSNQTESGGYIQHGLATNDIVLTTHPNPALGIATSRVIAPQTTNAYTHTDDGLFVIKNVTLPSANSLDFQFRISGSDEVTLQLASDGSLLLLDNAVTEISAGAATVSDGDDVVLVLEGADGEVFVAGTSAGTTSTIAVTTGTAGQRLDATDGVCDYIACFPRDVSGLLPPALV